MSCSTVVIHDDVVRCRRASIRAAAVHTAPLPRLVQRLPGRSCGAQTFTPHHQGLPPRLEAVATLIADTPDPVAELDTTALTKDALRPAFAT